VIELGFCVYTFVIAAPFVYGNYFVMYCLEAMNCGSK